MATSNFFMALSYRIQARTLGGTRILERQVEQTRKGCQE